MVLPTRFLLLLSFLPALLANLVACGECAESFTKCDPDGASLREVPSPGPDLGRLYLEMLYTVKSSPALRQRHRANGPGRRQGDGGNLCCAAGTECLLTQSFHIAMCWDKFTTNYFLPDGSYGTLSNGSYITPAGDEANLISGEYKLADGETGNIYDDDPADKPETSSLPMPTPFTNKGVGSAIPGSELGATGTVTTVTSTGDTSSGLASSPSSGPTITTTNSSLLTATPSATLYGTSTFSVTAAGTGGGYGVPYNNATSTTIAGPTIAGTSGGSMVTIFTSPPIVPSISMAAASFIYYVAPRILISAIAALVMG